MAAVWKLLVLIAVLLLPLGMAPATAAVARHTSATMPMGHCPGEAPKHDMKVGIAECTMACSAALAASHLGAQQPVLIACAPTEAVLVRMLHGLHPETATPPPKRS